jgi:hypothetical protein
MFELPDAGDGEQILTALEKGKLIQTHVRAGIRRWERPSRTANY